MSLQKGLALLVLYLCALAGGVYGRVFVLPGGSGATQPTPVFTAEPFALINNFLGTPATGWAIAHPSGSKYYLVSRSGSDTLMVVDPSFTNVLKRFNLGQNADAAILTPNGQRLIIAAGLLHMFETSAENEISLGALDVGLAPNDLAVSLDSTRLFVLSSASQRLTAIDLSTNALAGTPITIPGTPTGVAVAPNGFVYLSTTNRIYEVNPRTFEIRSEIPLNARPGKLFFTPDGKYGVTINQTPVTGSAVLLIDLQSRQVATTLPNFNVALDKLIVLGNNRVIATSSQTQALYDISLVPMNVNAASFGNIGNINNAVSAVTSNEAPTPRWLFVATPSSLLRIEVAGNQLNGQLALSNLPRDVVFSAPPATGAPSALIGFNTVQTATPGGALQPLVVRALNAAGEPVFGAPVTFSTPESDLVIQGASGTTNIDGYAIAYATAPNRGGTFTVNAAAGTAATLAFTVTTGGGTGGGGGGGGSTTEGGIFILSGQGQAVREQFTATESLTVVVRDASGKPIAGATVTWTVTSGNGGIIGQFAGSCQSPQFGQFTCLTDADGKSSVGFQAGFVSQGVSFAQTTITATFGTQSVTFTETSYLSQYQGQIAGDPTVRIEKPVEERTIEGKVGETIKEAIQVRVAATTGPDSGRPIPGVAIKAGTGNDPNTGPTAQCAGGFALTDAGGLATCDLVLGGRIGTAQLTISVGGFTTFPTFEINVLPGEPAKFNILQGNNQGGRAGQQLPLALVAQVTDAFGNILPGTQVTWSVVTGNSELVNTFRTADQTGRVSTLVRLGTTPGAHQIRVTAGQATATFTANVEASFGALTAVSGSGQQVQINQAFPQPLVVRLTDTQGQPISSIAINFAVASGSATLSSATATTNAQGQASVNVTAGGSPGPIAVTASVGNLSAAFNLSSRLPGPVFALADFMNAASFRRLQAIAPGMLLTISGSGFVGNLQNTITAGTLIGPMPLSLGGVEVLFGSIPAPIFSIAASSGGRQDITVQVPYEIAPGGVASVTIRAAGGGTTTLNNVPAVPFDPGIFEMIAGGQRIAVLVKDDGSVVTSDNPARRGDRLRLFITGIGQTSPGTATNRPGAPGQTPLAPLIVGVNNAGVPLISAEPLTGVVGIFVLTFDVPADTPSGPQITLSVGVVGPDGNPVYSQGSSLPVQ